MTRPLSLGILLVVSLFATLAHATVIQIHGSGAATGSAFFPLQQAFDAQPTVDPPTGQSYPSTSGGLGVALYSGRQGFVDFGPNFSQVRITGTWTLWKQSGRSAQTPLVYWWSRTKDKYFDVDDTYETTAGFGWIKSIPPNNPTTDHVWIRDYNGAAITPKFRYLIVEAPGSNTNGAIEFAVTGYIDTTPPPPPPPTYGPEQVLPIAGAGVATGSAFFPLERGFDDQPAANPPTAERYLSTDGGTGVALYTGRQGYIDFGANYANTQITGTWTLWRQFGRTTQDPLTYWWSNSKDNLLNNDDVAETTAGFGFITSIPPSNPTTDHVWHRNFTGTLTPPRRYLVVNAPGVNTNGVMEFAVTGKVVGGSAPPVLPAPAFSPGSLVLIDEVDAGNASDPHPFQQYPAGASSIQTVLGKSVRVLSNTTPGQKYFAYQLGVGKNLVAGKGYVLSVEYPDDLPRSYIILNNGAEYTRGFHTGADTVGDALHPPYVSPNGEALLIPQTGTYQTWQTLFHLHDRYPAIKRPRGNEFPRDQTPANGFWVIVAQFRPEDEPFSKGAAVGKIRLYEAPTTASSYFAQVNLPPAGLPQRHLFFREEMADGVINQTTGSVDLGVTNRVNWYEYKARLMKFLGMNTFSKDLLEFGHNQGWDSAPYGGNNWVYQSKYPTLWRDTITMLQGYDLNVLPYYEYHGSRGGSLSLGYQKRTLPLTRDDAYTHVTWSDDARADLTDPDTLADFKKMIDCTIVPFATQKKFVGAWLRARPSAMAIGFSDATRARFAAEANGGVTITRDQLKTDTALKQRYYDWWQLKRKAFIDDVTDYLRSKGVGSDAITLFTSDSSEPGRQYPTESVNVIAEQPEPWANLGKSWASLDRATREQWQFKAMTLPRGTWGGWEWQHSDVWSDPQNYVTDTKGGLTFSFNHAYTVARADSLDAFRSGAGLAMVRHYALNENTMTVGLDTPSANQLLGYFCTDFEHAGPYSMLMEARAVANGDPRFIGYLSSTSFNRGFPDYVRAFNQAFLALPALPSTVLSGAATDASVVVRQIDAGTNGKYLAIVNTSVKQVNGVTITLPAGSSVTDAATGAAVTVTAGKTTMSMYPGQLRSLRVAP